MEVNCVVSEAERAPAALTTWPLRWWLRNLREAAREGGEVARSFRLRRRAEEPAAGNALWLWLGVQAARMALLGDDDMGRLGRALRKLERASAGTDRFLLLLRRRCDDNSVVDGGAVVVPPRTGMVDLVTLYVPSLLRLLCARVACEVSEMVLWVKRAGALAG